MTRNNSGDPLIQLERLQRSKWHHYL
uniref:Uncharacterized protein n=1 Tax=Anguilla anguilla TaxID=7936 RepID=A0A0E9UZW0_ANGAN